MAVSEAARLRLFEAAKRELGEEEGGTLMDLLPPVDWSQFATKSDIRELRSEIAGLKSELTGEIAGVTGEIAGVKGELVALEARLEARMADGFADQTRMSLGQTRIIITSFIVMSVALVTLAFTAAQFAG